MANRYMVEKTEKDGLQPKIEELLLEQNNLKDQIETDSLRDFEVLEDLC